MHIDKAIEHLERYSRRGMSLPNHEMMEAAKIGAKALKEILNGSDGIRWSPSRINQILGSDDESKTA